MTNLYLPVFGQLAWIDAILLVWFTLTAISVIYVAYDAFTNNPEMKIMRIGWILVTLYLGPISLFLYIMSCQEPEPGTHEEFVAGNLGVGGGFAEGGDEEFGPTMHRFYEVQL